MHYRYRFFNTGTFLRPVSKTLAFHNCLPQRHLLGQTRSARQYGRSHATFCDDRTANENRTIESIEAVFVFHRHGDRTPGKSLVAEEHEDDESKFWKTKIPPESCYEILGERFPAIQDSKTTKNNKNRIDYEQFTETSGGNRSYGYLTWKGLHQKYHNGASMARNYSPTDSSSFLDHWDVQAVSTNFLRTVMSCQAFLDGLLTTDNSIANHDVPLDYYFPTHYEKIPLRDYARKHSCTENTVDVVVRDPKSETLNPFESSPNLMKKLMREVFATPEFIAIDHEAEPLKSELVEYLPGLAKHSSYAASASGGISLNWIHAADHFVCRSSHSVEVHKFCPHLRGDTDREETRFAELGAATLSHLQQRFHGYYSDPRLLGEMAGPALHDVVKEMKKAVSKDIAKKPFRIYSCHDVTILGLIYAIEGRSLDATRLPPQWPTYATCFKLELVRFQDKNGSKSSYCIRAWLNEAPIPSFSRSSVAFAAAPGHEPSFTIELSRFEEMVNALNDGRVPQDMREHEDTMSE